MKIEKTQGVTSSDEMTCVRMQEIILDYMVQCPVSKVIIDAEKISFYKFGLKFGIARHATNGIVYNNGNLSYDAGFSLYGMPMIRNIALCNQLLSLLNLI